MKPICVKCQRFYRPKKNDFSFVEGMPKYGNPKAGTAEPESWAPYKLWLGDLWECVGCGSQIVVGTGRVPVAEHFQTDFAEHLARYNTDLQVNDC